ncbi:hypothetical protein [Romeriopsis navalis]|uniref:hypothetical protein n=1 Tax=Romeriopsis navalis TaxID=2992132 RepID=UPI0021F8D325|nr:hypothetical protein [Romeriopsis navalis]
MPKIQRAQQTVYTFLLGIVKKWPPEEVLLEFKRLFLYNVDGVTSSAIDAIYEIVFANDQAEFCNTLKRCCYILVNNWDASRQVSSIKELLAAFEEELPFRETASPTLKRLKQWVDSFRRSQDFDDLKLFVARYDRQAEEDAPWANRFTSYLLVPQYINLKNPVEQREAARALAKQLRHQFKVDLAMYVARSQSAQSVEQPPDNPTALGDDVLRLIKTVVAKRGNYSYLSLSNIFLEQVKNVSFEEFKQSLHKYLIFSADQRDSEFVQALKERLADKLDNLYKDYESQQVNDALILRTSNRVIDFLTTENRQEPSSLFVLLLSQGNPMTLVVTLLKLILISRNSRLYLEARIADLIHYYENLPEKECWWVVNFLEIFNVTFTIYAENVQYNLIHMEPSGKKRSWQDELANLDAYRVFSQLRLYRRDENEADEVVKVLDDDEAVVSLSPEKAMARSTVSTRLPGVILEVDEEITEIQV